MKVQPYLVFDGRCEEAIAFYKRVLGAEVLMLMGSKEATEPQPPGGAARLTCSLRVSRELEGIGRGVKVVGALNNLMSIEVEHHLTVDGYRFSGAGDRGPTSPEILVLDMVQPAPAKGRLRLLRQRQVWRSARKVG